MLKNIFFVLSDASSGTSTKKAFPPFTDFSVINPPLAVFPAFVARPKRFNIFLWFSNPFHLPFQHFINVLWNRHFQRTLQSPALYRFPVTVHRRAEVCAAAVFPACGVKLNLLLCRLEDTDHFLLILHLPTSDALSLRYLFCTQQFSLPNLLFLYFAARSGPLLQMAVTPLCSQTCRLLNPVAFLTVRGFVPRTAGVF